jgi:transcriptional regulator with GAF, ATPase, and Fis domain
MAADQPAGWQTKVMERVGGRLPAAGSLGPVKTLTTMESFDEVRLLSVFPREWNRRFVAWLGTDAHVDQVELENPTDYQEILRIADHTLGSIRRRDAWSQTELCLHLSPGTPAMAAIWLLLGKTQYPATFYETYSGKARVTQIPFDLTIDVLPELLREPDARFQHLASEAPMEVEGFHNIIGNSQAIRTAVGRARRVAVRSVSALLLGRSGTGKELFAQAIHKASLRREKPFVTINCAALPKTLLESELFGHSKGAFTGAERDHVGAFERADGGTLFLDEVGECETDTQAKLLRVLQPLTRQGAAIRTVQRVGDGREQTVDVRIIAATNRDLHQAIRAGEFREDLYYRLAAVTISLPPLSDRKTDIPLIAGNILDQINEQFALDEPGFNPKSLSHGASTYIKRHDWPGNVRQLYNVLVQAAVLADETTLTKQDIAAALGEMPQASPGNVSLERPLGDGFSLPEFLEDIQRHFLRRAIEESDGVKTRAARLLGINTYQTLDKQLKRLGVSDAWSRD